jgi:hypothetical protein
MEQCQEITLTVKGGASLSGSGHVSHRRLDLAAARLMRSKCCLAERYLVSREHVLRRALAPLGPNPLPAHILH